MWTPRLARFVSWCLAIAFHEVLFIGALCVESEDVELVTWKPDVYIAMVPRSRPEPAARAPEWAGQWPIKCNHQSLLRMPSDQIVADTKCAVCGWPWWVVRTTLTD
jgi:hypothetical protein